MKRKKHLLETGSQLFRRFQEGLWLQSALEYLRDKDKMHTLLGLVAHLFHNRAIAPILKDIVLLYYYVNDVIKGRYKQYNSYKLVVIVALLIYVVTPIDIIPDWIPGAGFLDDAALVGYSMKLLNRELEAYLKWLKIQRSISKI